MVQLPLLTPRRAAAANDGHGGARQSKSAQLSSDLAFLTPRSLARRALPPSVALCKSGPQPEQVQTVYMWNTLQDTPADRMKIPVATLAMNIASETFLPHAKQSVLQIQRPHFSSTRPVFCYNVGENLVICKGYVECRTNDLPAPIARLPEGMYPPRPLCFAALSRSNDNTHGMAGEHGGSTLATLVARADGFLMLVARQTSGDALIDLSAVRFCTDKGITLVDEVSVHAVDVAKTRIVTLQGTLRQCVFGADKGSPLAKLPASCRPAQNLMFIVPGNSSGGFHLLAVNSTFAAGDNGHGGEIHWRDSIWRRDKIHLSGVTFEVHPNSVAKSFTYERSAGVTAILAEKMMHNFRRRIVKVHGSLEKGAIAFGFHRKTEINFDEFAQGCKLIGYGFEVTKLWAVLDEDRSGGISVDELLGDDLPEDWYKIAMRDAPPQTRLPALGAES